LNQSDGNNILAIILHNFSIAVTNFFMRNIMDSFLENHENDDDEIIIPNLIKV